MDVSFSFSPMNTNEVAAYVLEGLEFERKASTSDLQQLEHYCATCTDPQHIQNKLIQLFKEFEQRSFDKEQLVDVLKVIVTQERFRAFLTCHLILFCKYLDLSKLPYFKFPHEVEMFDQIYDVHSFKELDLSFLSEKHLFNSDGTKGEFETVCSNLTLISLFIFRVKNQKDGLVDVSSEGISDILVKLLKYMETHSEAIETVINAFYYIFRYIGITMKGDAKYEKYIDFIQDCLIVLERKNRLDLIFLVKKRKKSRQAKTVIFFKVFVEYEVKTRKSIDVINILLNIDSQKFSFKEHCLYIDILCMFGKFSKNLIISEFSSDHIIIDSIFEKVELSLNGVINQNMMNKSEKSILNNRAINQVGLILKHYLSQNIAIFGDKNTSLFKKETTRPIDIIGKLVSFSQSKNYHLDYVNGPSYGGILRLRIYEHMMYADLYLMHISIHKLNVKPYMLLFKNFMIDVVNALDEQADNNERTQFYKKIKRLFTLFIISPENYELNTAMCSPVTFFDLIINKHIFSTPHIAKNFISNYLTLSIILIEKALLPNIPFINVINSFKKNKNVRNQNVVELFEHAFLSHPPSMNLNNKPLYARETIHYFVDFIRAYQRWDPDPKPFDSLISQLHTGLLSCEGDIRNELSDYLVISTLGTAKPSSNKLRGSIANGSSASEVYLHLAMIQFVHLLLGDYYIFEHELVTKPTPETVQFYHALLANKERISQQSSELQVLLNQFNQFETLTPYQQRKNIALYLELLLTEDEKSSVLTSKNRVREQSLPNELASLFYPINHLSELGQNKLASSLSELNESIDSFTFDKEKFEDKVEVIEQQATQTKAVLARVASKTIDVESAQVNQDVEQAAIQGKSKSFILDAVTGSELSARGFKQALNILLQSKTINDFDTQIVQLLLNFHDEQLELLLQAENEVDVYSLAQTLELSRLTINCVASAAPEKEVSSVIGQVMTLALQVGAADTQRDDKALPLPLKVYMACYNGTLSQIESLPAWQAARDDGRINYPLLEDLPAQMPEPCSLVEAEQRLKPNEMLVQLYQNEQGEICAILSSNKKVDYNENSSHPQSTYYRFSPKAKSEDKLLLQELIEQLSKSDNKETHSVFSSHSTVLKTLWSNDENGLLSTLWDNCHELGIETVILLISGGISVLPWEWLLQKEVNLKEINQDHESVNPLQVKRIISLSHFRDPDDKANKTKAGMVYIYDTHDKETYFRHGEYQTFNRYFTSHARFFNWRNWFKRLTLKTISESTPVDIIQGLSNVEHCHIHLHASYNGKDPRNINIEAGGYKLPLWSLSHCVQVPKRIYFSSCESGMHGMTEQRLLSPVGLAPTMVSKGTEEVVAPLWKVNQLASFVFYHFLYEIQRKSFNKYRLPDLEHSVEEAKKKMREMSLKNLIHLLRKHNPGEFDISQLVVFYEGEPEPTISTSWLNQKIKRYYAWRNKALNQQVAPINFKDMLEPLAIKQFFWEKKGLRFEPKPLDSKPFESPFWWCGFVVYSRK